MTSPLENLAGPERPLRAEAPDAKEFAGLKKSGHALCLAALRRAGYRPANRYIVFQVLPHTLGLGPETWRVLAQCHDIRNRGEYEGDVYADERLVADLITACKAVADAVEKLKPL